VRRKTKRQLLLLAACYLVLVVGFAITLGYVGNMPKKYQLAQDGEVVGGTVTGTDCADHARVYYSFRVGGQEYSGSSSYGSKCFELGPGSPVDVVYVRDEPSINTIGSRPSARFENEVLSVAWPSICFPALLIGAMVAGGKIRAALEKE
jgi:hypothetical protein